MQIAPSAVFPLVFCIRWLFLGLLLYAETEELKDERVP